MRLRAAPAAVAAGIGAGRPARITDATSAMPRGITRTDRHLLPVPVLRIPAGRKIATAGSPGRPASHDQFDSPPDHVHICTKRNVAPVGFTASATRCSSAWLP
ncbi:MAG: hypothetical protein ABI379_03400, partial [Rhodanobacter sp.]